MSYSIYLESKLSLYLLIYGNTISDHIDDLYSNIDKNKFLHIEDIMHQILNKSRKLNVFPHEIYITKSGFLPDEFSEHMIESYKNYVINKEISNKDIYNISLCHNIFMNRKRLLYRDCFDMFDLDKKIYDDIQIFCDKYYTNNIEIKKVIIDKERLICGELDMYDSTEEKIIDFKTSSADKIQIEWILQLLTYASLMRSHTKFIVNNISF